MSYGLQHGYYPQEATAAKPCRPDYEGMIATLNKRIKMQEALQMMLMDCRAEEVVPSDPGIDALVGYCVMRADAMKRDVERLVKAQENAPAE